jgi:photosystem II stability/assembly factor-like uncharacterized protein
MQRIVIDPNDSHTLFAVKGSSLGVSGALYKSRDAGASWSAIGPDTGLTNQNVNALAFDPNDSQTVYAATAAGVFQSTDAGDHWSLLGPGPGGAIPSLSIDPQDSRIIYAGVAARGVYKSTDGGRTWSAKNNGITDLNTSSQAKLPIDPTNPNILYFGTNDGGVFQTLDGGENWFPINTGLTNMGIVDLTLDPNDSNILYAGTEGGSVFRLDLSGGSGAPQRGRQHALPAHPHLVKPLVVPVPTSGFRVTPANDVSRRDGVLAAATVVFTEAGTPQVQLSTAEPSGVPQSAYTLRYEAFDLLFVDVRDATTDALGVRDGYDLGTPVCDALTFIAFNHASTSNGDCFGW